MWQNGGRTDQTRWGEDNQRRPEWCARVLGGGGGIGLLLKGLVGYFTHNGLNLFFGCCSLTSQDETEGWAAWEYLRARNALHSEGLIEVREAYRCAPPSGPVAPAKKVPQLFDIYLRYGAQVYSPPAIDRRFKTIDFLVAWNIGRMDPRAYKVFFGS